jgi:hypothetical protein
MQQSPWENNISSASQTVSCILWNMKFHFNVPRFFQWSLCEAKETRITSFHLIYLRLTLILSYHLGQCLPSVLLPTKPIFFSACHIIRPPHYSWFAHCYVTYCLVLSTAFFLILIPYFLQLTFIYKSFLFKCVLAIFRYKFNGHLQTYIHQLPEILPPCTWPSAIRL